jgi:hypothetical protein
MVHSLMANAALHRDQIEIDAFGLYRSVPQGLQVIVFVARDCKFQFGHSSVPLDDLCEYDIAASHASQ